jgi:pimeloyl-ACP methyl ester carboxylesterase
MLFKTVEIEGLKIFYREAGKPGMPKLVLLHGFPASSHQYRNLMMALSDEFHIVAPDYPGFGNSGIPDPKKFAYTFDKTAEFMEKFLQQVSSVSTFRTTTVPSDSASSTSTRTGWSG